ncbi:MAG TPA: hypothetical protein VHW69_11165 [Rhizomicrobium sp.]|nr:hypothetical protein [Rhizomicrobium sp.]
MKRIAMLLALAPLSLSAQQAQKTETAAPPAAAPAPHVLQRLFILKYADPGQLSQLLGVFGANVRQSPELHALTVEASPDSMRAIEEAVQKLDVPSATPKNVELTMFLLVAGDSQSMTGGPAPKDLDSVVAQLKNTFPFKNYGLLDVVTFHSRTGQSIHATSSGESFTIGDREAPEQTNLRINSVTVEGDGSTLRIDRLTATFEIPIRNGPTGGNGYNMTHLEMATDLDIKEGQKAVVGRLGLSHDQALFLVMMGKIL